MPNVTSPKNEKPIVVNAPKKSIDFVLNYSKSYRVVSVAKQKIGLNLN